jgi:hypothetical protein
MNARGREMFLRSRDRPVLKADNILAILKISQPCKLTWPVTGIALLSFRPVNCIAKYHTSEAVSVEVERKDFFLRLHETLFKIADHSSKEIPLIAKRTYQ